MNVAAIIVTRGDQDLTPVLASLPEEWETLVWNNGSKALARGVRGEGGNVYTVPDLSVYGRYAAIEYTEADLIYVQDDDCVVSDPQQLLDAYSIISECSQHGPMEYGQVKGHWGWMCFHDDHEKAVFSPDAVVCNMPSEFRHEFYEEHALVGFGACFHRDAPARAFGQFFKAQGAALDYRETIQSLRMAEDFGFVGEGNFFRTCDIVFTALTPRVLVDVPVTNLPWAHYETRLWRQPGHVAERVRMLDLVRAIA